MDKHQPKQQALVPLCRMYENESKNTGKPYLAGNLTYTTKILGFQAEDDQGNACWQLYIQERPQKPPTSQPSQQAGPKARARPGP